MNKSPAFQFYPKDFLMDDKVAVMNLEQIGAYMKLLCYCWNNNGLPSDEEELKEMCGNPQNWDKIWKKVGKCFYKNSGKLYNKRLDKEKEKQKYWKEKSRDGGIKSGKIRRKKSRGKSKGGSNTTKGGLKKDEPNVNQTPTLQSSSPSSSPSSIPSPTVRNEEQGSSCLEKIPDEVDIRLTQLLIDLILKNDPRSHIIKSLTEKRQKEWINQCRLLREKDERTPDEIEMIIRWCQKDDFWKSNILSMAKLRKQFSQLWLKAKKTNFSGIQDWLEGRRKERESK